jgi:PAS domain S-box-containing protein
MIAPRPQHADNASTRPTVLIVDDNPTNLGVLTNYLNAYGYKTPIASNGDIAVKRAKHILPDLILLDVVMPGTDGFETCRRLKADEVTRDIPVIFMTALSNPEDKLRGFEVGGVDYVIKPFYQEEVLARVATHIRIRELTQHLREHAAELAEANAEIRSLNEQLTAENLQVSADLKETEQKYQTLVEEITDGYFVLQDDHIVFANQAFCRMHGYQVDDVIGKHFLDFVDPESRQEVIDVYHDTRQGMSMSHLFEYLRLTKTGESLSTEMTAKTTWYETGYVDIGICRDITKRIQMERRVREAERMAYIGRITASLLHELRNPLSAIKINLQVLKKNHDDFSDNDRRRVDISESQVARLEGILKELLDFAKPLQMQFQECHVNHILATCLDLLSAQFEQKNVSVIPDLASDLPTIQGDAEKLSQAFLNVLLNAFTESPAGGKIGITSHYDPDAANPGINVVVDDEGNGILKKDLPNIFEPFFTTKVSGTGLGLTNVKRIIEAHGGSIEAANREPRGASFHIFLPL